MRSIVGVGMTPPNVLGTPKPESSVIMSRIFGASLGGTMRGAQQALDLRASSLITPPNFGSGAGNCLPLRGAVALGEPGSPVVCISVAMHEAAVNTNAAAQRAVVMTRFAFIHSPCQRLSFGVAL